MKSIEYDAIKNEIAAVTVYQHDRAEVNRRIKFDHEEGQYEVNIRNLPSCIDEKSIRVDGIGQATILDVVYHVDSQNKTTQGNDDNVEKLSEEASRIKREIEVLDYQGKVLQDFSKNLENSNADIEKLEAYLNLYETRKTKLDNTKAELVKKERELTSRVDAIYGKAQEELVNRRNYCANVSVILQAAASGKVELSFTYVVTNATWTPLYDLRVSLFSEDKGQKSENTRLNLQYRASVYQSTGEDWKDVVLTLSTASPTQFVGIPTLKPARISSPSSPKWSVAQSFTLGGPPGDLQQDRERESIDTIPNTQKKKRYRKPNELALRFSQVNPAPAPPPQFFPSNNSYSQSSGGAISATFTIPGQSTIASSKQNGQVSHKVVVADLHFDSVNLEWITVPIQSTDVFLRAKVINTSSYVLLPGTANIFLDGSFVASSTIPFTNCGEKLSCSLGKDPSVRVSKVSTTNKVKIVNGSILQSSNKIKTTTYERVTILKNARPFKLSRLIVKDQVYVSDDDKLKVKILEPASLSESIKGTMNRLSRLGGTVARWTSLGDDDDDDDVRSVSESTFVEEIDSRRANGLFEWIVEMNKGGSIELRTCWTVSAPHDFEWSLSD